MKGKIASFLILYLFILPGYSFAGDIESRLNALEKTIKQQGETIKEQQRVISELKEQLRGDQKEGLAKAEEQTAVVETSQKATGLFGLSALTNPNISLVLNTFAYASNLSQKQLEFRNIPGYTTEGIERRKGFNLDSAELFLFAPVDPYFNLYATIPVTEDGTRSLIGSQHILEAIKAGEDPRVVALLWKVPLEHFLGLMKKYVLY